MNLYIISQDINNEYDTYDSAIVAAETSTHAAMIHPCGGVEWSETKNAWVYTLPDKERLADIFNTWVLPHQVEVKLIGTTNLPAGVVLASYNAG